MKYTRRELSRRLRKAHRLLSKLGIDVDVTLDELIIHLTAPRFGCGRSLVEVLEKDYSLLREVLLIKWLKSRGYRISYETYVGAHNEVFRGALETLDKTLELLCSNSTDECTEMLEEVEEYVKDPYVPLEARLIASRIYEKYRTSEYELSRKPGEEAVTA